MPTATPSAKFTALLRKLRELFELDKADLDFGIYRILRARREEIERFLREDLLPQVQTELGVVTAEKLDQLQKRVDEEIGKVMTYGGKTRDEALESDPVKKARALLDQARDPGAVEDEVYSMLTSFFGRYYDEGDFISQRRYSGPGKEKYMIPYNGEEVKLVWANMDQYYVKSAENFRDYAFRVPALADGEALTEPDPRAVVHFKLMEADTEKDNVKTTGGKRLFALADLAAHPLKVGEQEGVPCLVIPFTYALHDKAAKQADLLEKAEKAILADPTLPAEFAAKLTGLAPTEKRAERTLLAKHLEAYAAKNSFDYFIHKNLGGFLTRELDYFLKSEVLRVDDLLTEDDDARALTLKKARAFKSVAEKIITFLHRQEQFQKKLWLKKKFVVSTDYCITLDRIPEEFYPEIAANDEQREEWVRLCAINEIEPDTTKPGYSNPLTVEFLKSQPHLMVDTRCMEKIEKHKILSSIQDCDIATNGLCINSENFQGLNLVQTKFAQDLKCVYADPPFNTSDISLLYKNELRHSSWMAMVSQTFDKIRSLFNESSAIAVAIDDFENHNVAKCLEAVFTPEGALGTLTVEIKPSGRTNDRYFATSHEFYHFYGLPGSNTDIGFFELSDDELALYGEQDEGGAHKWRDFLRTGGFSTPAERPNSFYPIYFDQEQEIASLEPFEGAVEILPIDSSGNNRVWRKTRPSFQEHYDKGEIRFAKNRTGNWKVLLIDRVKHGVRPKSIWTGSKYDAASHGTKLLKKLFGESEFGFPKSLWATKDVISCLSGNSEDHFVLDPFSGSGTTGHAVIDLNRDDNGDRRYVLLEMGEHFDSVMTARLKKVAYSPDWKEGKPTSRDKGISHAFKILRLESYEDCLNNLELARKPSQANLLEQKQNGKVREDYLLGYFLDVETQGSILKLDQFRDPWNYRLKIATSSAGETKETPVDLVETFNWLIGLEVDQFSAPVHIRSEYGFKEDQDGRLQLAIRPPTPGVPEDPNRKPRIKQCDPGTTLDSRTFQTVEGTLRTGEKTLVIWRTLSQPQPGQDPARVLEEDNVMLEAYLSRGGLNPREKQWDLIYVNGDHTLDNLAERLSEPTGSSGTGTDALRFKVRTIEPEFHRLMFEGTED